MNICLILSGSIAAFKACELASLLVKAGHEVQTVATEGALHFVGAASLEGLTDKKVYTDLWAPRESKTHISLRRWADLFVFYPATANRINAMAAGLADDLAGATFLANNFEKPFWIAPAMNTNMLKHPATQASLATLESWGCRIVGGESGRMACGDVGEGRLVEARAMFDLIQEWASAPVSVAPGQAAPPSVGTAAPVSAPSVGPSAPDAEPAAYVPAQRVLVTGGAMTEDVDGVRSITNTSSGRTATAIARAFLDAGWTVDYLHHQSADLAGLGPFESEVPEGGDRLGRQTYRGFADFSRSLEELCVAHAYQAVVHAAAISDYRVGSIRDTARDAGTSSTPPTKLESGTPLLVELLPNPKVLPRLRSLAAPGASIVAFKLTVDLGEAEGLAKARAFIDAGSADMVVWNDLSAIKGGGHPFVLIDRDGSGARGSTNTELADAVLRAVSAAPSTSDTRKQA